MAKKKGCLETDSRQPFLSMLTNDFSIPIIDLINDFIKEEARTIFYLKLFKSVFKVVLGRMAFSVLSASGW